MENIKVVIVVASNYHHNLGFICQVSGVQCSDKFSPNEHHIAHPIDGIPWLCGVNTMPADALAPKVARASAGLVLAVQDIAWY